MTTDVVWGQAWEEGIKLKGHKGTLECVLYLDGSGGYIIIYNYQHSPNQTLKISAF